MRVRRGSAPNPRAISIASCRDAWSSSSDSIRARSYVHPTSRLEFFIILEGAAAVIRDDQRVAPLGPGDFFGEVGLLSTTWRVATVEALSPMRLLVIGPREFQTMMLTLPSVAEHVAQTAAARK